MLKKIKKLISASCIFSVTGALLCAPVSAATLYEQQNIDYGEKISYEYKAIADYEKALKIYSENDYLPAEGKPIVIPADSYLDSKIPPEAAGGDIIFAAGNDYIQWSFTAENAGLYHLQLTFRSVKNINGDIRRALEIDGKSPFEECSNLTFYRLWKDVGEPVRNSMGDEVRPGVEEKPEWQTVTVRDTLLMYTEGLEFYLSKGEHTLKLLYLSGDMELKALTFIPAPRIQSYAEVSAGYKTDNGADLIRFEAESIKNTVHKTDSVLRMESDGDPAVTPFEYGYAVMNVFGGDAWSSGGITWKFSVKNAGLYCLGFRVKQAYRDGLPSYRRILIDEEVPFREFEAYPFIYNKNWYQTVLGGDSPYYIYLTSGEHTLTMETTMGAHKDLYRMIDADTRDISDLVLAITMITGQDADPNYDYELERYIPGLLGTLKALADSMAEMMKIFEQTSEGRPAKYHQLKSNIVQLKNMINDPFIIPTHLDELNNILTAYGTWMAELKRQPLMVDFITFSAPGAELPVVKAGFLQKLWAGIVNFSMTFVKDYSGAAGSVISDTEITETLNIWVGRGTAWTTLIKRMADEYFTPSTGIGVSINTLPSGQLNSGSANALLLAVSSGRAPDISMGTSVSSVGEFALRNAVADLSEMSGFNEVRKRFIEQLFVPMTYKGKIYGIPETVNFKVMMFRKDILSNLGINLPNTWQELREYVIPVLYRSNMQFYIGANDFTTFLYQHSGAYYTEDLLYSDIGSASGYRAFKEYTDLFNLYGVPVNASFFNRFRSGETPIGIVDFSLYMQVLAAAPELYGRWGIAEIPGTLLADGTINRTVTGIEAESLMIMKQSEKKKSAWEFLKWWTSSEVQIQFGVEIESLMGETARWNSANIEAFRNMPWDRTDLEIITGSYESVAQIPVVLGGYFTARHITNAFNRTVVSGIDARTSIEKAVKDINRELKRRR